MSNRTNEPGLEQDSWGFDIVEGEFAVASADGIDIEEFRPLGALLRRVQSAFGMKALFIAEFAGGEQVVRAAGLPGSRDDDSRQRLRAAYGAARLGADGFEAAPVVGNDGLEYGTLCCHLDDRTHSGAVRRVAELISKWFTMAEVSPSALMPLPRASVMGSLPMPLR